MFKNSGVNIVSILMDDMGWRDLACFGSDFYETPNIDRLRSQGMLFSQAYAACPVCSPSRASMLTGQYPARVGITDYIDHFGIHPCKGKLIDAPYLKHLPDDAVTIAQVLQENGYATWHVGKWHLGKKEHYPEKFGFDVNIGGCAWGRPREGYFMPCNIDSLPNGPDGEHLTDRLTNEAIALIENRDQSKPFFLNMCHYDVHFPFDGKPEHIAYFEEKRKRMGLDKVDPFEIGEAFPIEFRKDQRVIRRVLQSDPVYAAMIYNLDWNIGRLLDCLETQNLMENTLIVFTSDNGGVSTADESPTCNLPAREGKGWMYEGGNRVPQIAVWQGHIRPGSVCATPTTTPDFFPTYLEAAGLPLRPELHVDGVSLMPLLTETAPLEERPIFWHYPHYSLLGATPASAVRLGNYKLILFYETNHTELYNLDYDLQETCDLSMRMPEKVTQLRSLLDHWMAEVEARFPAPNPDYQPWPASDVTTEHYGH